MKNFFRVFAQLRHDDIALVVEIFIRAQFAEGVRGIVDAAVGAAGHAEAAVDASAAPGIVIGTHGEAGAAKMPPAPAQVSAIFVKIAKEQLRLRRLDRSDPGLSQCSGNRSSRSSRCSGKAGECRHRTVMLRQFRTFHRPAGNVLNHDAATWPLPRRCSVRPPRATVSARCHGLCNVEFFPQFHGTENPQPKISLSGTPVASG